MSAYLVRKILMDAKDESFMKMSDVAPVLIGDWLTLLAINGYTQPIILLSVILPCVAALMGKSTVKTRNQRKPQVSLIPKILMDTPSQLYYSQ